MVIDFTDGFEYRPQYTPDAKGGLYFKKADGWTRALVEEAICKFRNLRP